MAYMATKRRPRRPTPWETLEIGDVVEVYDGAQDYHALAVKPMFGGLVEVSAGAMSERRPGQRYPDTVVGVRSAGRRFDLTVVDDEGTELLVAVKVQGATRSHLGRLMP